MPKAPIGDTTAECRSIDYVYEGTDGFERRTAALVPTGVDVSDEDALWDWARRTDGLAPADADDVAIYRNRAENTATVVRFRPRRVAESKGR